MPLPSPLPDVEMVNNQSPQAEEQKKAPPLPTRKPTQSDSVMMFGKQHDVSECMDNCMFQIEIALLKFDGLGESDNQNSVVKRLFYGKLRQRLTQVPAQRHSRTSTHEKEDLFSHLPVNVADNGFDIYDGLSGYFDDVVDYEGEKARMEVTLVDLPPLLQIQLQRVQFNRETLQPYKSQAYVKFGETIYMDRFLDTADPGKRARSKEVQAELNTRRERLRLLTQDKHAPFPASLKSTIDFLSKQETLILSDVDEELVAHISGEQDTIEAEIIELKDTISKLKEELENIWKDDTSVAYELTSVFIHRGSSPSFGHYFFYSRHVPEQPDNWFKYNDHQVTEVPKHEVLADTTGSTANPYLLVFAKKDRDIVRTVNRFDPMALEDIDT
jgi:ubiquitin carboxyl-terminal hydrolase 25/28